jgi:putative polyketide hydroxylase
MELGQFYRSAPWSDGRAADEPACVHPDDTRGHPGSRVPHAWLADGSSTIDCATHGLALLSGPDGTAWAEAATALGLGPARLPAEALDRCGIGPAGALLARPDGFVAWRAEDGREASGDRLRAVLATLLDRAPEPARLGRSPMNGRNGVMLRPTR